jgi:hypothetical protein
MYRLSFSLGTFGFVAGIAGYAILSAFLICAAGLVAVETLRRQSIHHQNQ